MLKRILVATDFSPHADAAWRFALDLARVHGAVAILLHVALEGALREFPERTPAEDEYLKRIGDDLTVRAQVADGLGVVVRTALRAGDPAPVIADTAREESADVIVVGTHAQRFANLLVGSVGERLLRVAPCSVLVVKGYAAGLGAPAA
jgi:nucleotide-binding universal stress UspA family protein